MQEIQILLILEESLRANGICRIIENIVRISRIEILTLGNSKFNAIFNAAILSDIIFIKNNPELICLSNFIEKVKNEKPETKIICLLENEEDIAARYFFEKGANGIISIKAKEEEYREAVAGVLNNYCYYRKALTQKETDKSFNDIPLLSDREFEVFTLSNLRFDNKEIAEKLCISYKTVKNHKHNLKKKLAVWD